MHDMGTYIVVIISAKTKVAQEVVSQSIAQVSTVKLQAKELQTISLCEE
jgi:hypothetical protein